VTFSKIVSTIQDSANTGSVNVTVFLSREKYSECLPSSFTFFLSNYITETPNSVVNWTCGKLYHIFSTPVRLLIQKLFWALDQNSFVHRSPDMISPFSMVFKFEELSGGYCSFSITCKRFSYLLSDTYGHMRAEPVHLVDWKQSVALFNELRKQKTTAITLCKNITAKTTSLCMSSASCVSY